MAAVSKEPFGFCSARCVNVNFESRLEYFKIASCSVASPVVGPACSLVRGLISSRLIVVSVTALNCAGGADRDRNVLRLLMQCFRRQVAT